jgi:signal recognition particle subunit SEC65
MNEMFWGDGKQRGFLHHAGDVIEHVFRPTAKRQELLLQHIITKLDREDVNQDATKLNTQNPIDNKLLSVTHTKELTTNVPIIPTDEKTSNHITTTTAANTSLLNKSRNNMVNPYWSELSWLGSESVIGFLHTDEVTFWQQILAKYLAPLDKDDEEERRIQTDLIGLRNNAGFAFFMLNAIWIILQFQCEYVATQFTEIMIDIGRPFGKSGTKVQVLGLLFMLFFASCMIIQFFTMILHRWGTFIEILASTKLFEKHRRYKLKPGSDIAGMTSQEVAEVLRELDIEIVVPTSMSIPKGSVTVQMESVINKEQYLINQDEEEDDYEDQDDLEDVYSEPSIDYFDHPAVQDAADESRLRYL